MDQAFLVTATSTGIAFLLAGTFKGVVGFGLPIVSVALITVLIDLPTAMVLMAVPAILTNFWQAVQGPGTQEVFKRIWLFLATACIMVPIGAQALKYANFSHLSQFLGFVMMVYAVTGLLGLKLIIPDAWKRSSSVGLGVINGVITGLTGASAVPGIMFLQGVGLERDHLLKAMGMLFSLSTLFLAIALSQMKLYSFSQLLISFAALVPAFLGMYFGQKIRKLLSPEAFRRIFFGALFLLGVYVIMSS